jgi:phosphate transport system substrate-binding protein
LTSYARNQDSGTFELFKDEILKDQALSKIAERYEDNTHLAQAVAGDPGGIGFVGLAETGVNKVLRLDAGRGALAPSPETIRSQEYPLARKLYFYSAASPANPWVAKWVEFATSGIGQQIVEKTGFIALAPGAAAPPPAKP